MLSDKADQLLKAVSHMPCHTHARTLHPLPVMAEMELTAKADQIPTVATQETVHTAGLATKARQPKVKRMSESNNLLRAHLPPLNTFLQQKPKASGGGGKQTCGGDGLSEKCRRIRGRPKGGRRGGCQCAPRKLQRDHMRTSPLPSPLWPLC